MKNEDVVVANSKYLAECISIIYTKIRAIGSNFFLEDGSPSEQYYINVEDYRHGTVSIACKNGAIKVSLDGTNYNILFKRYKNNGFRFYNKELGLEYKYVDKMLNDRVHLVELLKTVGDSTEYFKYTAVNNGYPYVLIYAVKDNEGTSCVSRYLDNEKSIDELIECAEAYKGKIDEKYGDLDEMLGDFEEVLKQDEESRAKRMEAGIKSQIEEFSGKDYEVINFKLSPKYRYKVSNKPYSSIVPDNVHDFDEGEYQRRSSEERKYEEKYLIKNQSNNEFQELYDKYNEVMDEQYIEDYDDEEEQEEEDSCMLDMENYDVVSSKNKAKKITEKELIGIADEALRSVYDEMYEVTQACQDIEEFSDNIKKIIYGRKRKLDYQKKSRDNNHNRSDAPEEEI